MNLPLHILASFNDKCSFLLNAIMEENLGHVPSKEEIRHNLRIESNPSTGEHSFIWNEEKIFGAKLTSPMPGAVQGEWDLPPSMMQNEYVKETLNRW